MRPRVRLARSFAALACALAAALPARSVEWAAADESGGEALAVVVHEKCPAGDLTFDEVRDVFLLGRQYWSGGRRIVLLLPPPGSVERDILLRTVYRMKDDELRKYWVGKLFAGEILAIPSVLRTPDRAASAVRVSEGAVSVMKARDVPPGLRVLAIDGKKPGEEGYPLVQRSKS